MIINGNIDRCDEKLLEGWITLVEQPETKLRLEVLLGTRMIGQCVANLYRQDLKDINIGNGSCAFSFKMPAFLSKDQCRDLVVRLEGSSVYLRSGHAAADTPTTPVRETASRFGGLWIDRYDWVDRLAFKHRTGAISDQLSGSIFRFVRDGYLVIEDAVPATLIDNVNDDVARLWEQPPEGVLIETFEPDGKMRYIPPDLSCRTGRTTLLDAFAFSSAIRQAIANAKVMEFLAAIFADRPKAFQSLNFWNGSQQAMHKDSAYVKVDGNPMHLAATWLALENIERGTGELEYYVGSHRAPEFLFGGSDKWMTADADEHANFLQRLHEDAARYFHSRSNFLAKPGDVLIWHADLAHGGTKIMRHGRTRRSLVTHFTGARNEPFYRHTSQYRTNEENGCVFVSQYYDIA
jgi:hypothetical protein